MSVFIIESSSISNCGINRKELFNGLSKERSSYLLEYTNNKSYPVFKLSQQAEQIVTGNNIKSILNNDRCVKIAAACLMNLIQKCNPNDFDGKGMINISTSRGNTSLFEKHHKDFIDTGLTNVFTSPNTTLGNVSSEISNLLNTQNIAIIESSQTCTSASQAILNSIAWLESGMADWVIAGGSEAPITPFTIAQVEALGIYTKDIESSYPCKPFNIESKHTFALGEGAALFLLRKKTISSKPIAMIKKWGASFQKPPSKTGINENGGPILSSMKNCISGSEIPELILAHAPGTIKGDRAEFNAINKLFKNKPNIISSKYAIGHCYGASSAFNIDLAIEILDKQITPQIPYKNYIVNNMNTKISSIMVNCTGFGGNAVSLLISK